VVFSPFSVTVAGSPTRSPPAPLANPELSSHGSSESAFPDSESPIAQRLTALVIARLATSDQPTAFGYSRLPTDSHGSGLSAGSLITCDADSD
jgi:hypothetical protein